MPERIRTPVVDCGCAKNIIADLNRTVDIILGEHVHAR